MSRYEWEQGEVKVPHEYWAVVRTAVIRSHNRATAERYKLALAAKAASKTAGARKRNFNRADWVREHSDYGKIAEFITRPDRTEVFAPKKKDFKKLSEGRSATIYVDEVTIHLNNKTRIVRWEVAENNHAVEHSRGLPVARVLFGHLRRVEYTAGTGGRIVGNDEYNKENTEFDGGANYVTEEFGPRRKESDRLAGLYLPRNARKLR